MTNSKKIFQTLQQMRNLDFNNERRFVHNKFYWNSRLSGLQAALAYSQIKTFQKLFIKNSSRLQYTTVYYHRLRKYQSQ